MNPSEPRLSSSSSHQPPEHLSEFFSFMNNKSNGSISPIKRGEERVGGSSGNGGDPGALFVRHHLIQLILSPHFHHRS